MLLLCAIAGMVIPAALYSSFNWSLDSQIGWGIPMATDTAFALGVLTTVRKYIPVSLLAFIVGLAIVDDVGAILVIALFYSQEISIFHLLGAFSLIALLALGNYAGIRQSYFYFIVGIITWWMMLKSGVHPTFAGVAIALTVPARPMLTSEKQLSKAKTVINSIQDTSKPVDVLGNRADHEQVKDVGELAKSASAPLRSWEDTLVLPVSLVILPLFALMNAGVIFSQKSLIEALQAPTGLGIIIGLVIGKSLGISGACWLGLRYNLGCLPSGVDLKHVIGASLIAGIGFTMSTFIATLGFEAYPGYLQTAKTAVLIASVLCALLGFVYFRFILKKSAS
jgi:NhaA family Na+:H+ antiporter